jgi:galactokinase
VATNATASHPFSIKVEPLATREGRYSWVITQGDKEPSISQESYATRREALASGEKVLRKMIDLWRAGK